MHGLKSPSPLCALDRGEGQGVFCWRRRCQKLSLKGVKTAWCTGSCLGGGVQCDMRHGAAVSLNNMKSVCFFFSEGSLSDPHQMPTASLPRLLYWDHLLPRGWRHWSCLLQSHGGSTALGHSPGSSPSHRLWGVPAASPTTAPPAEGLRGVSSINALQQLRGHRSSSEDISHLSPDSCWWWQL